MGQSNSTLTDSLRWIRRIASPSIGATLTVRRFGNCFSCDNGSESVTTISLMPVRPGIVCAAEIRQPHPRNVRERPDMHLAVPVLADHVRMHVLRIDIDVASEQRTKSRRVQRCA